ncbi:rCG32408 [Rattus norvegicus]|uniref:RCG32408 n=1 Tax=Rattus norvegicus TaxID=10116 RepID=A6JXM0_RAT|nr:rCG32408 [Rattus norvegicus]
MCLQRVVWLSLPPMTATTAHTDMSQTSTLEQHFHIREGKGVKMFSTVWKKDKMISGLSLLLLPPCFYIVMWRD